MNLVSHKQVLRNDYKLQKAREMLNDFVEGKTKFTPQHFIAEQKIIKSKDPDYYKSRLSMLHIPKTVKYYRNKYGQQGVTETSKHLFESKPFIEQLLYVRSIFSNNIKNKLLYLTNQNNEFYKHIKGVFNEKVYSWKNSNNINKIKSIDVHNYGQPII